MVKLNQEAVLKQNYTDPCSTIPSHKIQSIPQSCSSFHHLFVIILKGSLTIPAVTSPALPRVLGFNQRAQPMAYPPEMTLFRGRLAHTHIVRFLYKSCSA